MHDRVDDADGDAAAESEARLRRLADNLPHAMIFQITVAPDGARRFSFVGQSCERLNGITAEAALADPGALYGLVAPEDRERLAAAEAEAMRHCRPFDIEAGFILPDGSRRWSRISSAPRRLPDGTQLWDGVQLDITESRLSREQLLTEQNRLELAVEATGLGLWSYDLRTGELDWDDRVRAVYGLTEDVGITYETYLSHVHPEDRERVVATYRRALETGGVGYQMEHRTVGPDGEVRWVLGCARIQRDSEGQPLRLIGSTLDITARKRAEQHLRLMVHELNHRVKNSLAVVQAVCARTLRSSDSLNAAGDSLGRRLMALARAHDVLTAESWEGAGLREVAQRSLDAIGGDGARVAASGPYIRLRPSSALTFALVFHELGTNAVKYGALSNEAGRVQIDWSADPATDRFALTWSEHGGPTVRPPSRQGFGRQLIERGLAGEADGDVRLDFRPEGLVCSLEGRLSRLLPAE